MSYPSPIGLRLLNEFQHGFPLVPRPFAKIGSMLGLDETTVLDVYREGQAIGAISRVGAVVAPRRVGASTLAAMAVPAARLMAVADSVNARAEVNHNYEREGTWNLWFVVVAPDMERREQVLQEISTECGLQVLSLPLRKEYHIDLGFDLNGGPKHRVSVFASAPCSLDEMERALLAALQNGLSLSAQPFKILGDQVGLSEHMVIELIEGWLLSGMLKRFGVVVRHRELGFTANAMCVWDVPDDHVDTLGHQLALLPGITLCYQRQRALPNWPYNLYCMIHGKHREAVEVMCRDYSAQLGLDNFSHDVLFSRRRFKQCGASYSTVSAGKTSLIRHEVAA